MKVFSFSRRKKEKLLSDLLPYERHVSKHVIELSDRSLMCVAELSGASFATRDNSELNLLQGRLHKALQNHITPGFSVHVLYRRSACQAPEEEKPSKHFAGRFRSAFEKNLNSRALFENRIFLAIIKKSAFAKIKKKINITNRHIRDIDRESLNIIFDGAIQFL